MYFEHGAYGLMCYLPAWTVAVFLLILVLLALSEKVSRGEKEAFGRNLAYYACAMMAISSPISVIKTGRIFLPWSRLQFGWVHAAILIAAMGVGTAACYFTEENRLVELFRNIIVDPLFFSLIVVTMAVVHSNYVTWYCMMTYVLAAVWLVPLVLRMVVGLLHWHRKEKAWQPHRHGYAWFD